MKGKIIRDKKGRFVKGNKLIFTEEHKIKISKALKGQKRKPLSKKHREKISNSLRGHPCYKNPIRNRKISVSRKGKKILYNHPFKFGGFAGRYHKKESKRKISKNSAQKGKPNKWGKHTKKAKEKIALANKGSKSHLWKGGEKSWKDKESLYSSNNWKKIRESVIKRDKVCQICKKDSDLIVHHKTHYRIGGSNDGNNLITLCRKCHAKIHIWETFYKNNYVIKTFEELSNELLRKSLILKCE